MTSVVPVAAGHRGQPLLIEPKTFRDNFNRKPFSVGHRLVDHPLLSLPRLIQLAQRLPESQVTVRGMPQWQSALSLDEVIRRIEDGKCWMLLKRVEQDPEYQSLLDSCLDQVNEHSQSVAPGMRRREAFIFVTSPGFVTSYHIDSEYNFLLQVRGAKTLHVFDGTDRDLLSERELESYFSGASKLIFRDDYQAKATTFELHPGFGVHVPVTFPHWVQNGSQVSISFSMTFQTPGSDRRASLYRMNALLRRLSFSPAPIGAAAWRDVLKYQAFHVVNCAEWLAQKWKKRDRTIQSASRIDRLSPKETVEHVRTRLAEVGLPKDTLTVGAISMLHDVTAGSLVEINRIGHNALLLAFRKKRTVVGHEGIEAALQIEGLLE